MHSVLNTGNFSINNWVYLST